MASLKLPISSNTFQLSNGQSNGQLFDSKTTLVESSKWSGFLLKDKNDLALITLLSKVALIRVLYSKLMKTIAELSGPEKIEEIFLQNQNFNGDQKDPDSTKNIFKKLKIHHLLYITPFLRKRFYKFLPSILKDIFYWHSVSHKAPASKTFAKTEYDEQRTLLDIKVSKRALRRVPERIISDAKKFLGQVFASDMILSGTLLLF